MFDRMWRFSGYLFVCFFFLLDACRLWPLQWLDVLILLHVLNGFLLLRLVSSFFECPIEMVSYTMIVFAFFSVPRFVNPSPPPPGQSIFFRLVGRGPKVLLRVVMCWYVLLCVVTCCHVLLCAVMCCYVLIRVVTCCWLLVSNIWALGKMRMLWFRNIVWYSLKCFWCLMRGCLWSFVRIVGHVYKFPGVCSHQWYIIALQF